jgi:hypothetical protein
LVFRQPEGPFADGPYQGTTTAGENLARPDFNCTATTC